MYFSGTLCDMLRGLLGVMRTDCWIICVEWESMEACKVARRDMMVRNDFVMKLKL